MYTVCDIIEKLILIEQDAMKMYGSIAEKCKGDSLMLSIMAKTLASQEARHVIYYENLRNEMKKKEDVEIDFFLYDKVAKLLYEFREKLVSPELQEVQGLIRYALEFEKKNVGLLLDIQGRLVVDLKDASKTSYEVISKMIQEEKEHEIELAGYLAM